MPAQTAGEPALEQMLIAARRFDLMAGESFAPGVVALVTPDGSVRQVADGLAFPNGMLVTHDNSTLIVAEGLSGTLMCPTNVVCVFVKGVKCCRGSISTGAASLARSEAPTEAPCS